MTPVTATCTQRPLVIAHRGANSFAPENSLQAFQAALRLGCDGIEMDLRLTASGDVVVFHDRNLSRMTGCRGSIHRLSLDRIRQAYLEGNPEYRIPTLQEALDLIQDQAMIILDVKKESFRRNGLEEKILDIVRQFRLEANVIISSFNPQVLRYIASLAPHLHLGFIFRNRSHRFFSGNTPLRSLHAHYRSLSERYIRHLHQQGYHIFAWTVDQVRRIQEVVRLNVDGIITNRPEEVFSVLNKQPVEALLAGQFLAGRP